jgi:hypothetical protein
MRLDTISGKQQGFIRSQKYIHTKLGSPLNASQPAFIAGIPGQWSFFPRGQGNRRLMLTTRLYLMPKFKNGAIPPQEGQSTVVPVETVTGIPLGLNHF